MVLGGRSPGKGRPIARSSSIGIEQASATLRRAAHFLGGRFAVEMRRASPPKVIGNGLRELDRFLSVLLDEIAAAAGLDAAELGRIARVRNTARKLGMVGGTATADGIGRLRALGRCRDMLFHCEGIVRRGDHRGVAGLTLGWPSGAGQGVAAILQHGDRIIVGPDQLAWISAFYEELAGRLVPVPAAAGRPMAGVGGGEVAICAKSVHMDLC